MAADAKIGIWVGSDTKVVLAGLKDEITDAYVNDATVTYTLRVYDAAVINTASEGAESVFGALEDESMAYEASSRGKYVGLVPDTTAIVPGTKYWVDITATTTGGTVLRVRKLSEATFYGTKRR